MTISKELTKSQIGLVKVTVSIKESPLKSNDHKEVLPSSPNQYHFPDSALVPNQQIR